MGSWMKMREKELKRDLERIKSWLLYLSITWNFYPQIMDVPKLFSGCRIELMYLINSWRMVETFPRSWFIRVENRDNNISSSTLQSWSTWDIDWYRLARDFGFSGGWFQVSPGGRGGIGAIGRIGFSSLLGFCRVITTYHLFQHGTRLFFASGFLSLFYSLVVFFWNICSDLLNSCFMISFIIDAII